MTNEEIKKGLLTLDRTHAFYGSLMALMTQDIEMISREVASPNLDDGQRHYKAGELAHAIEIRDAIQGTIREAEQERDQENKRKEARRKQEKEIEGQRDG